jgi:hypothetical protein
MASRKTCDKCRHFIKKDIKNLNQPYIVDECSRFKIKIGPYITVNYPAYAARENSTVKQK